MKYGDDVFLWWNEVLAWILAVKFSTVSCLSTVLIPHKAVLNRMKTVFDSMKSFWMFTTSNNRKKKLHRISFHFNKILRKKPRHRAIINSSHAFQISRLNSIAMLKFQLIVELWTQKILQSNVQVVSDCYCKWPEIEDEKRFQINIKLTQWMSKMIWALNWVLLRGRVIYLNWLWFSATVFNVHLWSCWLLKLSSSIHVEESTSDRNEISTKQTLTSVQ